MCDSPPAVWRFCAHFFTVCRVAPDRRIDCACIFFQIANDHSVIPPCDMMLFELFCKDLVRTVIFADEKGTCCVHIDPVDDPRAEHPVDP